MREAMISCGDKEPSGTEGKCKCSQLSSVSPTLFPLNILEPAVMHLLLLPILMICVVSVFLNCSCWNYQFY